jgi:hypothetical protein
VIECEPHTMRTTRLRDAARASIRAILSHTSPSRLSTAASERTRHADVVIDDLDLRPDQRRVRRHPVRVRTKSPTAVPSSRIGSVAVRDQPHALDLVRMRDRVRRLRRPLPRPPPHAPTTRAGRRRWHTAVVEHRCRTPPTTVSSSSSTRCTVTSLACSSTASGASGIANVHRSRGLIRHRLNHRQRRRGRDTQVVVEQRRNPRLDVRLLTHRNRTVHSSSHTRR